VLNRHSYDGLAPLRSFRMAILESTPDFIIPCDELAMLHLHRLHAAASQSSEPSSAWLKTLIECSIGDARHYPIIESRTGFLDIAREEGVATPDTQVIDSEDDVKQWLRSRSFPVVLKADGTSGGEGVLVVQNLEEALAAYRRLRRPLGAAIVAKRALIDRDSNAVSPWLLRRKRVVSMQSFVSGPDANIAVACWQGGLLASISVEVVRRCKAKGPSTVVRVLEEGEMLHAAQRLVRRLGLSGLIGFDFMIDDRTRKPYLIEINARATQTAHLSLGPGRALPAALTSRLSGVPLKEPELVTDCETMALFPLAWRTAPASEFTRHLYHDVPWEEPDLVRAGFAKESRFTRENWARTWNSARSFFNARPTPTGGFVNSKGFDIAQSGKFRVLHLIGSNLVGGPEKQILHHAEDLKGSEYEVEIGSFHDLSEWPEILLAAEQRNLATVCLKGGIRLDLIAELSDILRKRKGYLLCTHGFKANVVGYLAAKRTQTLHIAFVRGWTAETMRVKFYEVLERQALKRAQHVVCVSQKQAERVARMRKKNSPPLVIPNAMLPPYSRQTDEVVSRESLGISNDAFIFGSVGRLSAEKGHRFLISAFHELHLVMGSRAPISLIVVGDGREQIALERQASELGIREKIIFAGFQGSPGEWMRLFGCLVQPSLTEGTPNSVLEALCLSVPVVATAVGGVPDLVADGRNGLLVSAGDSTQLAAAMRRMVESPELRHQLISGGSALKEEYSPTGQRRKLITAYQLAFRTQS
jgi:glycosyltransferase involved in cell wall biosynthesis